MRREPPARTISTIVLSSWINVAATSLKKGRGSPLPFVETQLPEQLEHGLGQLVRLPEHRVAGLHEDIEFGEIHHFLRHVEVADPALGSGQVLAGDGEVVDRVVQPVLVRAEARRCDETLLMALSMTVIDRAADTLSVSRTL